jgi:hypothetical protein
MSHNRFIIELLTVKLNEAEAKIDKPKTTETKTTTPTPE